MVLYLTCKKIYNVKTVNTMEIHIISPGLAA